MKRRSELRRGKFVKRGRDPARPERKETRTHCPSCGDLKYSSQWCSNCGEEGEKVRDRKRKSPEPGTKPRSKPPRRTLQRKPTPWDKWRPHLRDQFERVGITECEVRLVSCLDCQWVGREPELDRKRCPRCKGQGAKVLPRLHSATPAARPAQELKGLVFHCWHRPYTSADGTFNDLTFAHVDKRRFLSRLELYLGVVRACWPCHDVVEKWGKERVEGDDRLRCTRMRVFLEKIIAERGWTPSFDPPLE